jgi:hypothetical protein
MTGSNDEINVLQRTSVSARLVEGNAQEVCYESNDHEYDKGYYLADDIYLRRSTFVKTIHSLEEEKCQMFTKNITTSMTCRKDVERSFGVLQYPWAIV